MERTDDWRNQVFFKTDKAHDELTHRKHGLRSRARQVLVMIDGVRALNQLGAFMSTPEMYALVTELESQGFIHRNSTSKTPAPIRPTASREAATKQVAHPEQIQIAEHVIDPVKLARVKAYLIESSEQHLGLMASKLQNEIAVSKDEESLRRAIAHWNMAMRASRSGAEAADICLATAHNILGWKE